MVRMLSLVALAATAVVAVLAPAAAAPTAVVQRGATPAAPFTAAAASSSVAAVAALHRVATVHAELPGGLDIKEMALRALEPLWEAYKAGKFDKVIDAFKRGELDDHIPSEKEVLDTLEHVMEILVKVVPRAYKLLEEVKEGKHDDFLDDAKDGSLEDFLESAAKDLLGAVY